MKGCFSAKRLGTFFTVFVLLFVSFSGMVAVQGAGEPQSPYVLVQNFESMTSNQDVTSYYDNLSVEPGCTGELSLSNNGGLITIPKRLGLIFIIATRVGYALTAGDNFTQAATSSVFG